MRLFPKYEYSFMTFTLTTLLPDVVALSTTPSLVVVCFGANDAALPDSVQHVPLDMYAANLALIVNALRSRWPGTAILLLTPPPLDDEGWARKCADEGAPVSRTHDVTAQYAERCVLAGRDCGVPVADLRVDWAEDDPIGELETLWGIYKPQLNDYVTRALNPSGSPSYGVPGDE